MKGIAALLAALCVFSPVKALAASEDTDLQDHEVLIALVEKLGIPVYLDHDLCNKRPELYGLYNHNGSGLLACPKGDRRERLGTIRHEAWHVYQDLIDCKIKDTTELQTALANGVVPTTDIAKLAGNYPKEQLYSENEARWVERNYTAHSIAVMMFAKAQACGFRF